jgi:hypothetical protein
VEVQELTHKRHIATVKRALNTKVSLFLNSSPSFDFDDGSTGLHCRFNVNTPSLLDHHYSLSM